MNNGIISKGEKMEKIIEFAHRLIASKVTKDDICIDMTIGNGKDTLFLCSLAKFVYGFDIQPQALSHTQRLLEENAINNYQLWMTSHENVDLYVKEKVKAIVYNLGYLPLGDKKITTMTATTLASLKKALLMLKEGGIIVMVIYPGHLEGMKESQALLKFTSELDQKEFDVIQYQFINQIHQPPYTLIIERRKLKNGNPHCDE